MGLTVLECATVKTLMTVMPPLGSVPQDNVKMAGEIKTVNKVRKILHLKIQKYDILSGEILYKISCVWELSCNAATCNDGLKIQCSEFLGFFYVPVCLLFIMFVKVHSIHHNLWKSDWWIKFNTYRFYPWHDGLSITLPMSDKSAPRI